jgi:transcriptional regulator with XRE-family HTH domain
VDEPSRLVDPELAGCLMPTGTNERVLDHDFIRRRRLALGISERSLADTLRVGHTTLRKVERGDSHPEQSLAFLLRLAEALATTKERLVGGPGPVEELSSDASKILAVLLASRRGVEHSELQRILDLRRPRVQAAIEDLKAWLLHTPIYLHRSGASGYILRARDGALTLEEERRLKRVWRRRSEVKLTEALMLRRAVDGNLTGSRTYTLNGGAKRAAIGALLEHGLLDDAEGGWVLSPEVEFSLGLRSRASKAWSRK